MELLDLMESSLMGDDEKGEPAPSEPPPPRDPGRPITEGDWRDPGVPDFRDARETLEERRRGSDEK